MLDKMAQEMERYKRLKAQQTGLKAFATRHTSTLLAFIKNDNPNETAFEDKTLSLQATLKKFERGSEINV